MNELDEDLPEELMFNRSDYDQLPEGFPAQLVEGELVRGPAADYGHQRIVSRIHLRLADLVGPDRVVESPIDVVLDNHNVYQPDLLVLPRAPRSDARYAGMPVLVVEVLSPTTARLDRVRKRRRYLEGGVEEVWLVDRVSETIEVYTTKGARIRDREEAAESEAVEGFRLSYAELFAV
jgi:Uma2 family endonuclease